MALNTRSNIFFAVQVGRRLWKWTLLRLLFWRHCQVQTHMANVGGRTTLQFEVCKSVNIVKNVSGYLFGSSDACTYSIEWFFYEAVKSNIMIVGVSYFIAAVVAEESPRISWPSIIISTPAINRTELCLRDLCRITYMSWRPRRSLKNCFHLTATIIDRTFFRRHCNV